MSPELRHLRYFVAIAEDLSFSRAARRLHVAPQTLSSAIQQLERELGVQLLVRTTRSVELTDAGRALVDHGRRTLEMAERTWDEARSATASAPARLCVAYTATLARRIVPAIHDAAGERLAGVELSWREAWASDVVAGVRDGRYGAGLARHPERDPQLASETIAEEQQGVLLGAGHRLAGRDALHLADLAPEPILMFPRDMAPAYHDALLALCREAGFEPRTRLTPDSGHVGIKVSLLERGEVVAIAPEDAARSYVELSSGRIVFLPLAEPAPLPIDVVWDPVGASAAVTAFVDLVRALAREGRLTGTALAAD
jgi:DNA-binding transcriptional LysR family regulator